MSYLIYQLKRICTAGLVRTYLSTHPSVFGHESQRRVSQYVLTSSHSFSLPFRSPFQIHAAMSGSSGIKSISLHAASASDIGGMIARPIVSNRDFAPRQLKSSETPGRIFHKLDPGTGNLRRFTPPHAKDAESGHLYYDLAHQGTDRERRG